jgi:hypothetical protein
MVFLGSYSEIILRETGDDMKANHNRKERKGSPQRAQSKTDKKPSLRALRILFASFA